MKAVPVYIIIFFPQDVTSPGYSWWDVKPPAVSSSAKIQAASREYVAFLGDDSLANAKIKKTMCMY